MRMTEARLNDLVYLLLKKTYFEPLMGTSPRESDIRICMDMAVPERIQSITQAILMPNEVSGRSHDIWYEDVDVSRVFDVTIDYLIDHWRMELEDDIREEWEEEFLTKVVPAVMAMPEDQVGG